MNRVRMINPLSLFLCARWDLARRGLWGALAGLILLPVSAPALAQTETTLTTPALQQSGPETWGLEQTDWVTYQTLMHGEAGLFYAHLPPTWVLGIYATDPAERARYARLVVLGEKRRLDRLLAFNRQVIDTQGALFPAARRVDRVSFEQRLAQLAGRPQHGQPAALGALQTAGSGQRLGVFVSADQCPQCVTRVEDLVAQYRVDPFPFDIYFVDAPTEPVIQTWARARQIPLSAVQRRDITLNYDPGGWQQLGKPALPFVWPQDPNP